MMIMVCGGDLSQICHLSPSFNPPFFPSLAWTLQGVCTRSPAAKHFDVIYAVKQAHKIHIDV